MTNTSQIVWIINQFAGTPRSGWGERHFYFAKYWIKKGYKPIIISGSFNHMFNYFPDLTGNYTSENYEGIEFCWVKTPVYKPETKKRFWSFLVFSWKVLFIPLSTFPKPDVVVVSSMPIFPILSGYILKKFYGAKKLLFEIRDIWPLTLQLLGNRSSNHPAVILLSWFEKFGYRNADTIVSLLPNAEAHYTRVAKKKIDIRYIPNGIDENQVGFEDISKELLIKIPKNKFIVGYAGTIGYANALEYFINVAQQLDKVDSDIHFLLVGDGYLKEKFVNRTIHCSNITFLPKIRKSQVQSILKYFDVGFIGRNKSPLFRHGVSANKYFDYMLAGIPILDSNQLIKDPVELSGCGIIVEPDRADLIIDAIYQFKNMSKEERTKMGELGKEYVLEHHSIQHLAEQYTYLFE
jgi:glycosyltransferase involved in cell wall biosynthesis